MPVQIKTDISGAARVLGALRGTISKALAQGIAESLWGMAKQTFERQASPEGERWQILSDRYGFIKTKLFPGLGILYRRGFLRRSLYREARGNVAVIGSHLPYAAIHQFGGRAGRGHKAQIPARPFLPAPETAEREAQRVAEEILQEAIARSEGSAA